MFYSVMREKKRRNYFPAYMTLSVTLIAAALYSGIATPSVRGAIGTIALVFVFTAGLEFGLYKIAGFRFKRAQGLCLIGVAVAYCIFVAALPSIAFYQVTLSALTIIYAIILAWEGVLSFTNSTLNRVVGLLLIFGLTLAFLYGWQNLGSFSTDSYNYYEIAQTFADEYGKVGMIGQYVLRTDYSAGFPYFYPLVLYITNCITNIGRYSGVFINIYLMLYTILAFIGISKYFVKRIWHGVAVSVLLLSIVSYAYGEVFAFGTIPLALLGSALCFYLCARLYITQKKSILMPFLAGVLAGIVMVTRFDGLALGVFCALLMYLGQNGRGFRNFFLYAIGLLMLASPWIFYSLLHFNKLWISSNSGTMFLVETATPSRLYLPSETVKTLFNAPLEWMLALAYKFVKICYKLAICSIPADIIILVYLIIALKKRKEITPLSKKIFWILVTTVIYCIGKTLMYTLVGYGVSRYHIETVVLFTFVLMMVFEKLSIVPTKGISFGICSLIFVLFVSGFCWGMNSKPINPLNKPLSNINVVPRWISSLDKRLDDIINDDNAEIFYLTQDFSLGGWIDRKIYIAPNEANWAKVEYAMKNYMDVEYVLCDIRYLPEEIRENLDARYEKKDLGQFLLYKVK